MNINNQQSEIKVLRKQGLFFHFVYMRNIKKHKYIRL